MRRYARSPGPLLQTDNRRCNCKFFFKGPASERLRIGPEGSPKPRPVLSCRSIESGLVATNLYG